MAEDLGPSLDDIDAGSLNPKEVQGPEPELKHQEMVERSVQELCERWVELLVHESDYLWEVSMARSDRLRDPEFLKARFQELSAKEATQIIQDWNWLREHLGASLSSGAPAFTFRSTMYYGSARRDRGIEDDDGDPHRAEAEDSSRFLALLSRYQMPEEMAEIQQIYPAHFFETGLDLDSDAAMFVWDKDVAKQTQGVMSKLMERMGTMIAEQLFPPDMKPSAEEVELILLKNEEMNQQVQQLTRWFELVAYAQSEASKRETSNVATERLDGEQLKVELNARETVIKALSLKKTDDYRFVKIGQALIPGLPIDKLTPHAEQELAYGAYLLAPSVATAQWLNDLERAVGHFSSTVQEFESRNVIPTLALGRLIADEARAAKYWEDKTVWEVGGHGCQDAIIQMGGEPLQVADAGHGGYGLGYSAGERSRMVDIENYQSYGKPHSADIVCSSRLFDLGSGIGAIAERGETYEDTDTLGNREMTLVMLNMLKDGGYMIHYDGGPRTDFAAALGLERVANSSSGAMFYRWRKPAEVPYGGELTIGAKKIAYNKQTLTWERVQ